MKERPILFSAPMVRALLDGTKTQTRRVVKVENTMGHESVSGPRIGKYSRVYLLNRASDLQDIAEACPYGQPGDRLFVRETGWERPERTPKMMREGADTWEPYYYDADDISDTEATDFKAWGFKRRPSIHMPRWASRITLEVVSVRVERLQEISERDAADEGCGCLLDQFPQWDGDPNLYRKLYRVLWCCINGAGSWAADPLVWVVEFKVVKP